VGGDLVSVDAVKKVTDSEKEAKKIVEDAKVKAKEIIEKAKEDADMSYKKAIDDAETKKTLLLDEAREEGERRGVPILDEADKVCEEISQKKGEDSGIVKLVVERIVNNYGNS